MIRTSEEITSADRLDQGAIDLLTGYLKCSKEDILFVDIETTGLSPKNSDLYLIGTGYFRDGKWIIDQFFAGSKDEEAEILSAFADFVKGYDKIVHFNGDRFDVPFLKYKYEEHHLRDPFEQKTSLDLLKCVKPYKNQLGLADCKQKSIEQLLGIDREDQYDGGKLIFVYKEYTETRDQKLLTSLFLHNFEDVQGMLELLPVLYYQQFFNLFKNMPKVSVRTDEDIDEAFYMKRREADPESAENEDNSDPEELLSLPLRAVKVQANRYKDFDGKDRSEVYMKLALPVSLPTPISGNEGGCFFKAKEKEATLKVPLYEMELKYFYSNYKDYYYLPQEDMAIHKSLATFVDKNFREKARPENCYTKKEGQYLMEWDLTFAPFFKRDYTDKNFFFDLNENMKRSRFAMSLYACHAVAHILDT